MNDPIATIPRFEDWAPEVQAARADWSHAAFGIDEVHKRTQGAGVTLCVLDTGCDLDHPDLRENIIETKDFTSSRVGADDENGHGTHVTGTICANGLQKGIAPEAKIRVAKVLDSRGSGSLTDFAAAIHWAIDTKCDIINISAGARIRNYQPLDEAIRAAVEAGIFIVCAAGNDGVADSVNYPANHPLAIAITAVDRDGKLAPYASRGAEVELAGPGTNVQSTWIDGGYRVISGTSMSSPFAAGLGALILSQLFEADRETPSLEHIRQRMAETATDAGKTGRDPEFGWGLINPADMVPEDRPPPPILPERESWKLPKGATMFRPALETDDFGIKLGSASDLET